MNAAALAAANSRFWKILQVEHRRSRALLDQDPQGEEHSCGGEAADHDRVVPAAEPAARDAEHEAGQADHERGRAEHVIAAHRVRLCELAQDQPAPRGAGERERDVEPEHPVPRDRDQRAAEHRAEHEADRGDHRVDAHRQTEFLVWERVGDQRGGVREQERRADALQDAPQDQDVRVGRETGAERGEREQQEAADVGALAPEQVAQAPSHQHQHGGGDQVGEDHPHECEQAGVQRALEVGEGDDQRAGVGRGEQHAEAGARQRPPLVVLMAGGDAEASAGRAGRCRICLRCGAQGPSPVSATKPDVNVRMRISRTSAKGPREAPLAGPGCVASGARTCICPRTSRRS